MECIFSNIFRGGDFLRILTVLSDLMVPLLIFYVVGLGLLMKQDVFGDFLNGAKDGMRTVIGIVPTLIGLMAAVGVPRGSVRQLCHKTRYRNAARTGHGIHH